MASTSSGVSFPRDPFLGVSFAVLAAVGFSAKAILVKLAYFHPVDAVTLLTLRMAFSVPFFAAAALWARGTHAEPLGKGDWMAVLGLGFVGYYLSSYLDFLGLEYISAGLERLILFLYPTLTVIISALVYKRAIGRTVTAAMALSYVGIALVFFQDVGANEGGILVGASLVFASTLTYSIYLVGAGHAIARIGSLRFTAYASLVASAACVAQFLATHPLAALDVPKRVYEISVAMAVFSTVLPVFLLSFAIRRIGPGSTSLIGSIGPISTLFMAYLFLGESLSWLQMAGSALVLAGVLAVGANGKSMGK